MLFKSRPVFTYGFMAVIVISLVSCKQQAAKPVTKEEAKEFSTKLEVSIRKRQTEFFNDAMDKKELMKRSDFPSSSDSRDFQKGLERGMLMGNNIVNNISEKGTYELVKQYEEGGIQHLLFRLYDKGSLNYHDMELIHNGEQVRVADMYVYTTGQKLSETLHGIYIQMKDILGKNSGVNPDDDWIKRMPEIRKLLGEEKYSEALELYNNMPATMKNVRAMQIMHIQICSGLTMEQYDGAIEEYKKLYPNEPNMQLLMLDGYIMHKEYDKALTAVNELDKKINTDPLMDYYRYLCYNLLEDKEKGIAALLNLMKNKPDFEEGMLELIASYFQEKDFKAAKPWVDNFKSRSSFDQTTLNAILENHPEYYTETEK